ncbi:DsrE/DsrF/DrsH-like family protein [Propionispira raffinosivorans]|uniref:DsrE/DsrF/DrsH-like family protein n=1 Tax=Propionispira raffinosivorans TaxID=86959 RepID=UPI00036D23A4|nr:DsrE/DsrF/DrsH-like family protein [Propionispira raffinosivorans]
MKKYIIVGGVAGGATAAARLRRLDESAKIILFERGEYVSFANCGLPYYIGDTIKDRDRLLVQTPEKLNGRFNIDVRVRSEVTKIDTKAKQVTVQSIDRGVYEETYDALILAPGAQPLSPPIPGIDSPKIVSLRNIPDADELRRFADDGLHRAAVIGGGFIGIEMAENLRQRGLDVTIIEAAPHILALFDTDMVKIVEKELVEKGIKLILADGVKKFKDNGNTVDVSLSSGKEIQADFVVLAIGVRPDTQFLQNSGIKLGARGHIVVNEHLQTNAEDVYAVGDAVEIVDFVSGGKTAVPLAGPANRQGRIAADNIVGIPSQYKGVQGTSILKVFDLTAASTGSNERSLQKQQIPYKSVQIHPESHAGYYPGARQMTLKLLFDSEGRILGAQAVGAEGVDKRIDVIATVLRLGGTIYDLTELELAYAPPFSSAKDPVNMAGYAAENVLSGLTDVIAYTDLPEAIEKGVRLIDVRTDLEYENGHLSGAVNFPLDELRNRLIELDKTVPMVVYCKVGLRGYIAERILKQNGFLVKNLLGGYTSALQQDFTIDEVVAEPAVTTKSEVLEKQIPNVFAFDEEMDLTGLSCPGPLMKLKLKFDMLPAGKIVKAVASDAGFYNDSKAWCDRTHNLLLKREQDKGQVAVWIQKGSIKAQSQLAANDFHSVKDDKTIVVFSGDMDKAIASFIIANGAATMDKKVTMFFTFWGLNILRKPENVYVEKSFIDKMFGWMMPQGSKNLQLSKMNMFGLGTKMMRQVMQNKNIDSLESLIKSAQDNGIEMIACQMSMDVMGIKQEELIDGVQIGGVGAYLSAAEDANVNLFI